MGRQLSDSAEKAALAGAVSVRSVGKKDEKKQPQQPTPLGGFGKPVDEKK